MAARKKKKSSKLKLPGWYKRSNKSRKRNIFISILVALVVIVAGVFVFRSFAATTTQLIQVASSAGSGSGMCLEYQGARVNLQSCSKTNKMQQWKVTDGGTIESVGATGSYKCMNVADRINNTPIQLGTCSSRTSMQWVWSGGRPYNGSVSSGLCFGTVGGNNNPGSELRLYTCKTTSKKWNRLNVSSGSTSPNPSPTPPSSGGSSSTNKAELARQILSSRLRIADYSEGKEADRKDRALASQQLADIAKGLPAKLSVTRDCGYKMPRTSVEPNVKILQFLAALGADTKNTYTLNVLFGQCHSSPGTLHHSGAAVDFECRSATFNVSAADAIAKKYGVGRNSETCAANSHWHYQVR